MKTLIVSAAAVLALASSGLSAQASCGDISKHQIVRPVRPPQMHGTSNASSSIVGMWEVNYSSGGNLIYQALEQWHSDGLEFEFADIPTITGDVCMGVWSKKGKSIALYHTAWTFDNTGAPNGTMVLTHSDKVAKDGNTFAGSFDLKFYDIDGNLQNEITGDDAGTRIAAP